MFCVGMIVFYEVFDGIIMVEQFVEIFMENGGIKFIVFKSMVNKECFQMVENWFGWLEVQVDFSGDMWWYQFLVIQYVRKQQVVYVVVVVRYIYQFMIVVGQLVNVFGVMDVDVLVKVVLGEVQNMVSQVNYFVREICCNFFYQCNCVLLCFFMGDFFVVCFIFYCFGNGVGGEQFIKQILMSRQMWVYSSQMLMGKVYMCYVCQFLCDSFICVVFICYMVQ